MLHPALNLTSALLAAPGPAPTVALEVSSGDIDAAPRGAMLGIAGAPATLPSRQRLVTAGWSLCGTVGGTEGNVVTTAVIGTPAPGEPLPTDAAAFVVDERQASPSTAAFLLWDGRRLPVDRADRPLVQALGLDGIVPRPVSAAVLDAVPDAPPVDAPRPAGIGAPGAVDVPDTDGGRVPVGTVLRAAQADGRVTLHLVHRDGVETLTPVLADLLLARWGGGLVSVASWRLALLPDSREARASGAALPPSAPRLVPEDVGVLCASWQGAAAGWTVSSASALDAAVPVSPVGGNHSRLDQVQIPPGSGAVVQAAGGGATGTPTVLITDLGIAYPVDDDVPTRLGLLDDGAAAAAAPAAVLDVLPAGPRLSTGDAGRPWTYDDSPASASAQAPPS